MNKLEYKQSLQRSHPEEPDEVLNVAWHFHSLEKAKYWISILATCNCYADVASKVIHPLYVSGEIDSVKAVKARFLSDLLPFTTMERAWKAHSAAYHVRKMLADDAVKSEREAYEKSVRKVYAMQSSVSLPSQASDAPSTSCVDIHIHVRADNEELIQKILEWISKNRME